MTDAALAAMVRERAAGAAAAMAALEPMADAIAGACAAVLEALDADRAVLTCGNGGSAAEALHLAEELVGNYRDRARGPRRAVCLNADPTALTCIANDFGYDAVFARQVEAIGRPGDVLVVLSTSGRSANVVAALEAARGAGIATIGLLGKDGGPAAALCDHALIVPGTDSGHVQEAHLALVHVFCEAVERAG